MIKLFNLSFLFFFIYKYNKEREELIQLLNVYRSCQRWAGRLSLI